MAYDELRDEVRLVLSALDRAGWDENAEGMRARILEHFLESTRLEAFTNIRDQCIKPHRELSVDRVPMAVKALDGPQAWVNGNTQARHEVKSAVKSWILETGRRVEALKPKDQPDD